ncbi:MAG: DUF167 family protein [Candidatus Woesearchaeota archaeon]
MEFSSSFKLIVKTNMPKTELGGYNEERKAYLMNVHAAPKDGKANLEIVKFFKREFGKDVSIARGLTSKQKIIKII